MIADIPRASLGFWPTPLHPLERLSKRLGGPEIYIKRDDQSGLGLGGNKVRKLEFLIGDAIAKGCDTIITGGASQSNHCRQSAAAAANCNLECHLVLGGGAPLVPDGNLLLDELFGAHLHWSGEHRKGEDIPAIARELTTRGRRPYIIPYGGSNPLGALGFAVAVREAKDQLKALRVHITHIVFASSSGGTHAGLLAGARQHDLWAEVYGIAIDKGGTHGHSLHEEIGALADAASALLGDRRPLPRDKIHLDERFVGKGYGMVGALEREAIELMARTEGILLDPVYSGRAFGALLHLIRHGAFKPSDKLLFWHTGGTPALYPYAADLLGRSQL